MKKDPYLDTMLEVQKITLQGDVHLLVEGGKYLTHNTGVGLLVVMGLATAALKGTFNILDLKPDVFLGPLGLIRGVSKK